LLLDFEVVAQVEVWSVHVGSIALVLLGSIVVG
jgi:uncharacterized membrane protein